MNAPIRNEIPAGTQAGASMESEKNGSKREDLEFKITVRKLEIPVRPRGVLAE